MFADAKCRRSQPQFDLSQLENEAVSVGDVWRHDLQLVKNKDYYPPSTLPRPSMQDYHCELSNFFVGDIHHSMQNGGLC